MEERTQHRTSAPERLRFVLGNKMTDVALPAEVPLGDVLPAVLSRFGGDLIEKGAEHEGYVVQRLGEPPLDEERTSTELNLLDGETVYLRPRADQLAPIDYDDLVDGVAEQIRNHPGGWTPQRTRWMLLSGSAAAWMIGLLVLLVDGTPGLRAGLAGVTALALLAAASVAARAAVRPVVATMLAGAAAGYAAVAGGVLVSVVDPAAAWLVHGASAGVAALVTLFAGLVLVADAALLFVGAVTAVLVLTVPMFIGATAMVSAGDAAAIGLVLTLIVGLLVPGVAFRLSGLTLPMLPTTSEELKEDIDPVPHEVVVDRGKAAIGYLNALHIGTGLAQSALLVIFLSASGLFATVLNAVLAVLLFLRAKHLDAAVQRWAVLVPAGVAVFTTVVRLTGTLSQTHRFIELWVPIAVVATGLLLASERLSGKRLRPYWGRAVDILETLTAVAVVPLLLGVLNVYQFIRGVIG